MKRLIVVFILLLSVVSLHAYEINDEVDEVIAKELKLGKGITIVDFFASWCSSCEKELPLINKLSKETNEDFVKYIGVATDENLDEGLNFQKKLGLDFFVYNDINQKIVSKFNPIGMPAIYYVKDKKIVNIIFGAVENVDQVIKNDIEKLQ